MQGKEFHLGRTISPSSVLVPVQHIYEYIIMIRYVNNNIVNKPNSNNKNVWLEKNEKPKKKVLGNERMEFHTKTIQ